ncbi:MAG: ABC transporter permease [Pseudomonadota bacterium]|nr:ABC transporter permease [Pseudomonadota bacterium]
MADRSPVIGDFVSANAQVLSIGGFLLAMFILFSAVTDTFFTAGNILNLLRQAAPMITVAVAMTLVIITGGIDLSVGSTVALVNALAAIALGTALPWPIVAVGLLLLGALIGSAQGWFITHEGIPAFIVTLAGMSMLRGVALLLTQGFSIPISAQSDFVLLGRGWVLGVPLPVIIATIVGIAGMVVLGATRFGRYIVAIGANREAARRSGIAINRVTLATYALTGAAAAVAGLIIAARLGSGSSNAAVGFELEVIAAVGLGGTSLMGGRGSIVGTVLGALTIAVIGNGLILAHVSPFFTQIITGAIILGAIWLNIRVFFRSGKVLRKA